jgi:hypothetical protein
VVIRSDTLSSFIILFRSSGKKEQQQHEKYYAAGGPELACPEAPPELVEGLVEGSKGRQGCFKNA